MKLFESSEWSHTTTVVLSERNLRDLLAQVEASGSAYLTSRMESVAVSVETDERHYANRTAPGPGSHEGERARWQRARERAAAQPFATRCLHGMDDRCLNGLYCAEHGGR